MCAGHQTCVFIAASSSIQMDLVQQVRTNLSCDQCFRSKVKCCRTKPQCSRCKRLNFTCTHSPGLPRGKPKAKNYCLFQLPSIEPSEAVNCDVTNRVESPQSMCPFHSNMMYVLTVTKGQIREIMNMQIHPSRLGKIY